jgi:hypothetical protein
MTITVSLKVTLGHAVKIHNGFRVEFEYESDSLDDAELTVHSGDAAIREHSPKGIGKGNQHAHGHVEIGDRQRSLVGLEFRLEVPGGGGLAIDVKHVETGPMS